MIWKVNVLFHMDPAHQVMSFSKATFEGVIYNSAHLLRMTETTKLLVCISNAPSIAGWINFWREVGVYKWLSSYYNHKCWKLDQHIILVRQLTSSNCFSLTRIKLNSGAVRTSLKIMIVDFLTIAHISKPYYLLFHLFPFF